jgi:hypothetical protein
MAWNKSKIVGFMLAKTSKTGDKDRRPGILRFSGPIIRRPHKIAHGGQENPPNLSAEDGMENTASCMERQSDQC